MADSRITQASFTTGEVSPSLYGRKDLAKRAVGVQKLDNMFVHATGGTSNRAGLRFVGDVGSGADNVRIMRFESAADEAFLTVWADGKMYPVYHGSFVMIGGNRYYSVSPYTDQMIADLYMDQSNDVATITHPDMPVYELSRHGVDDWRFTPVDFSSSVPIPIDCKAKGVQGYADYGQEHLPIAPTYKVSAVNANGEESLPSSSFRSNIALVLGYSKNYVTITWEENLTSDTQTMENPSTLNAKSNNTYVSLEYKMHNGRKALKIGAYSAEARKSMKLMIVLRDGNLYSVVRTINAVHKGGGWLSFTIPNGFDVPATGDYHAAIYADRYDTEIFSPKYNIAGRKSETAYLAGNILTGNNVALVEDDVANPPTRVEYGAEDGSDQIIEYIVYKGKNGVYGSIGRTPNKTFKDDNIAPDFANGPVGGRNPFEGEKKYPSIVFFSQQRRGFAHTINRPQSIWMTSSANYRSMNVSEPMRDADAIEFTLAAERKQDIFHVISLERGLIVFTRSGEWKVTGRENDILTPSSILPQPQSRYGANKKVKPLVVGESILFANRSGNSVMSMEYSFEVDRYTATDLTLLSKHLFSDKKLVNWDYAENPDGVIYCVMNDGSVNCLTYLKEHDVWGWSTFRTSGEVEDIAVVPEGGRDSPYFLIKRRVGGVIRRYIEVLERRDFTDINDSFFVDSGLSYDYPQMISSIGVIGDATITVPDNDYQTGDRVLIRDNKVYDRNSRLVDSIDGYYDVEFVSGDTFKLKHTTSLEGKYEAGDYVDLSHLLGKYSENGECRRCTNQVFGLDHLEGLQVVALCDGAVVKDHQEEPMIVELGTIPAFDRPYGQIHVGLPYESTVITLDLAPQEGDDTGLEKASGKIIARYDRTRGVKYGQVPEFDDIDINDMVELVPRSYEDYGESPKLVTGLSDLESMIDWNRELNVVFIQDEPLPFTLTGITIEYDYGGS